VPQDEPEIVHADGALIDRAAAPRAPFHGRGAVSIARG
jgi:hypothetical protein